MSASKSVKLSIITVTLNCKDLLKVTLDSLQKQADCSFEVVIVDAVSTDGTLELAASYSFVSKILSEKDKGIYDAMNKGLDLISGDAVLFLNAGDFIEGDILKYVKQAPTLLPVKYRVLNRYLRDMPVKSQYLGMPYCHQGIVFRRSDSKYNLSYRVAADYDYFLRQGYDKPLEFCCGFSSGHVYYDNGGFSQKNRGLRDSEIQTIIRQNFGAFRAAYFSFYVGLKNMIKKIVFS